MLVSIIKIAFFILVVAAIIFGVNHLMETPGGIEIAFGGWQATFTPLAFVGLVLAGFVALWVLFKIVGLIVAVFRFIIGDETAITRFLGRRDERRGMEALASGMSALASGDARKAKSKAEKAERLLKRPGLTRLLNAQAAELSGDKERAKLYYKALAEEPETAFVGVRGLMHQAVEEGDKERALILAKTAAGLKKSDGDVLDTLYTLQTQSFDWTGARSTLAAQKRVGMLPDGEAERRDAMLALAQAEDAEQAGDRERARKLAVEAAKLDPTNAEAVSTAARYLIEAGSTRAGVKLIVDSWRVAPSAQLAAAYADLEPDEAPAARRRRFDKLFEANAEHPEARYTRAELALVAEDWREARAQLQQLDEPEPTARYCAIMAAISRGEGRPEAEVRAWLARALGAPRDEAGEGVIAHAAMLPLLVGDTDPGAAAKAPGTDDGDADEAEEPKPQTAA